MKKNYLAGLIFGLMLVGLTTAASATIMAVGDPFDAGSWAQQIHMSGAPARAPSTSSNGLLLAEPAILVLSPPGFRISPGPMGVGLEPW